MSESPIPPLELDVRPLLAAGRPPLGAIMNALTRLQPGQSLRLRAPFEPLPLYAQLQERGLRPESPQCADGSWDIVFRPAGVTE